MSTQEKTKPGRKSMKKEDKKKPITCVLSPELIKNLKIDTLEGKAQTPNQRVAQIVELFYRDKKESLQD
jgi:hypothetical protein